MKIKRRRVSSSVEMVENVFALSGSVLYKIAISKSFFCLMLQHSKSFPSEGWSERGDEPKGGGV